MATLQKPYSTVVGLPFMATESAKLTSTRSEIATINVGCAFMHTRTFNDTAPLSPSHQTDSSCSESPL